MALSEAMRKRINQNIENKAGGSSAEPSSVQESSVKRSSSLSSAMQERIRKNIALKRLGREDPGVDENFINKFQTDYQKYVYDSQYYLKNMTYQNSRDSSYAKRIEDTERDLSDRATAIRTYLDLYRGDIGDETYKSMSDYLDQFDSGRAGIRNNFSTARSEFSKWETEDDYNAYVAKQKDYEEKSKFDIDAGRKEIASLEEELSKLRQEKAVVNSYQVADNAYLGSPYAAAQQGNVGSENDEKISELEKLISQKKQYLNQAKHIQEGITLSGVVGNDDFDSTSQYKTTIKENPSWWENGVGNTQYEWINNQNGFRDEYESSMADLNAKTGASSQSGVYVGPKESIYKEKGYDHLTENEIAIYNYYYAKEGEENAQEYLDSIQETLNIRKATGMYEDMEEDTLYELAFGVAAGLDQFKSGAQNLFNTEDDYIPQTAYQIASGMVREDLKDVGPTLPKWLGGSSLGQVGYDAITTSANMAPSILASVAIGILNPTAGAITGNALMGASAAGNAYQEALNNGYDKGQARVYSTMVGASEAILGELLGGISSMGGTSKAVTKMLSGVDNAFLRFSGKMVGSMISEGIEEGLQEVLTPMFENLIMHTDKDVNWSDVAYSFLLGSLTAGIMEGPTTISNEVNTYNTGVKLQEADISAQSLAEIGNKFSADTVAYQLAGRVNENTGAYTMGRLFNEIGATLTEQNVNDITNTLVAKNMPEAMARKNAKVLAAVVDGAVMSDEYIQIIEANEPLAQAVNEVIISPNSTVYQRTKGYNEALMALAQEKAAPNTSRTEQALPGQENADVSDKVDTQNENGSEVDTSPAKVKGISNIKDGQVTIKLEDDSEVSLKDADLDPDDGVRIETIASIDGITAADADFILNALRTSTSASAQMDALGAKEAYKYGFYGLSKEHITKHGVFANSLTEAQRDAIYEKGRNARQQQVEKNTPKKADGTVKQTGIYFDTGNGNFVPYSESNMTVDKKRSAGVQAAMVLHKLGIGGDIYFFNSYVNANGSRVYKDKNGVERPAPNGWYSKDGSIYIDLNAGNKGEGYVLFTLAHELTHFIEQWSPQKYKILADFLVENYEKGQSMDKLVHAKQDKLSKNRGKKVSYKEAYSEVVADSMEAMLADGNVLEKLIELKAKDNALFNKMKQFFDNLLKKIRSVYKDLTPDSDEGKAVLEMTDSIEKIQKLFADALVEASDNFRSAEKNTTQEGGEEMYSFRGKNKDGIEVYETSEYVKSLSWKERKKLFLQLMRNQYRGRTAKFVRNGHAYYATFEYRDVSKNIYGDTDSDPKGRDAKINVGADGNIFELVEHSEYFLSEPERGKTQRMHRGVKYWDYFIKTVQIDGDVYDLLAHIRKKDSGNFVYDIEMYQNKKIEPSSPEDSLESGQNGVPNSSNTIIRNEGDIVNNKSAEALDIVVDSDTESVAPAVLMSERTWTESDYVQERENAAKEIAKAIGVSEKKAKAYIDSVNSIAKMIAEDRVRLDYFSSPGRSSFVSNVEYGGSFDFSTLCKKRRLLTGTFTAIQKALPNTALTANEILDIRNRMKKANLEVSCGLCYVEGSRANMGQFAKEFLKLYKQYYPDAWQPNMADVNTPGGIEWVRINHPECYGQYEYFWNHYGTLKPGDKNLFASQQKPKLYQLHTEYKGEILEKFNDDDNVEEKNLNGGILLQSFSDFEIVHLIDTMQIIMDMSRVGLAGQAYTKVPDFAWALGDTGLKINLSLIAKGVDANGKLIFDDVEGMPIDTAVKLRNRYSKNVGTILVSFNDEQLLAAMADDRVDFIIPFHRSQWKKSQYEAMGLPAKTKDYTYMQNEKFIKPQYHEYRGRMVKDKATNYMPNEYWDFSKSGKENAEAYLEMCARNNKRPKFYKLLQNNGDGSYSLKADGSTDGYWKLLIDFKMYDNDGNGSPQMPVKPEFNMDEATRMLNDYKGGHSNFPVAQGIVDDFVKEYKDSHKGVQFSDRDSDGNQLTEDQQKFFKDSKVRDSKGNLIVLYHGTSVFDNITEFRTKAHNANRAVGLWLSDSHHLGALFASYMGDEYIDRNMKTAEDVEIGNQKKGGVYKLYANLKNPLVVDALVTTEENFGGVVFKNYKQPFYHEIPTPEEMKAAGEKAATVSGEEIATFARAHGYDGVIIKNVKEGYGTAVTDVIAFEPNQVKYADNRTPTSGTDIRYSDRDTESVSNRSLLANAFESVAQNDIERNKIQEYKEKISHINAEERKLSELNEQIKELSFAKGPKDTKKIRDLQIEARKTANRINIYDSQLLRLEASKPLQNVLNREKETARKIAEQKGKEALAAYREKATKTQREMMARYQESRQKAVAKVRETAEKRDAKAKLQKLVLDTAKWISYPAKTDVKCPDILKQPYADFLNSIDMSSERLSKGGDPTKNDLRLANAMGSLATALEKIMASQDPTQDTTAVLDAGYLDLPAKFIKELRDMTEDVKAMMIEGEYVVNTMTAEEVRKLSQMIRTLNHAIKEVSTLYANLRFANVEMLGDESMTFMDAIGEIQKTSGTKDFVQWDNALPYYAFKRFGKGGESIFEGLMDAQDKLAFLAQKIFNFQEKAWKGDEAKKWSKDTHTIDLPDGEKLTLTTADAMSVYCLSRRQQGLQHLLGGGVRVMGIQKGSKKAKDSRSTLTIKDIDAIISSLTDRQKKVAEAIQEFMSTTCSEWGNEISMKRFLTKEFNEKFYFPIESNDENLPTKDPSAQQSDLFRLLNISATKPIDPRANNEVIIRNIFDVFTGHASDMARLNAFGLPLLDYMKWLNYREKTVNEEGQIKVRGVRKYMETAYGNAAKSYVLNLIKDVNGRPSDNGDPSILMKWMRAAKTASVGSSLRVATLQLTSYPRAALVLSPKSLALGLTKAPKIEKAKKYCGIALWKSFGFYDTNISRSIEEQMKGVKNVKQQIIELSLKGAEIGDAVTWGAMWNACEYEVASTKKYKVGSEEFYEAVGKKLREVVYRTQVVDSTLTRSQIMRNKRGMAQEAAAFMSEPTLSANILMDANMEFSLEKRRTNAKTAWKKTGKYVMNAIAVYSIGQLTAALLEGFWDAWRDDEDEEFGEKFASAFKENLIMDLVPFNKIPIVSDIFEAVLAMFDAGYYSSDKMSTTWLTQAVSAADAWRDVIGGNSSVTAYNALYKTMRAVSSFIGVSISGVMREGVALWNNTAGAYDVTLKILNYDRSKAELGSLLLDAIVEGNDRQADSLRAEFEDEDAYQSALRSAIKERYLAGEIDTSTDQKYLVQYGGKNGNQAHWLTEEWMYENDSDEDFGKYNKFYDAVKTGKNLKAVIKEYTANGVKPETLAGQITEHFKPDYIEMSKSEKASIKGYLLNAFEQCGVKREDAAKKLQHWEFLSDNPGSDLNQSQVENYHEFAKPAGISAKLYTDYCRKVKGITGDDKKEKRMAAIDSLPITSAQKDALYYAEGWAASKLNEAPWH